MVLTDFVKWNTGSFPSSPYSGRPLVSSPGGIRLQDYHWSGGMYSPEFITYDKWGHSEPRNVYGFDNNKPMLPPQSYANKIDNHPVLLTNYELIDYPVDTVEKRTPVKYNPIIKEKFETAATKPASVWRMLLIQFCLFLIIYMIDKMLGDKISSLHILIKGGVIASAIVMLILLSIIKPSA